MAGIGFTLKRLFSGDSFTQQVRAYAYSSLVAAGPWIASVLVVNILTFAVRLLRVGVAERHLFLSTIVYCFVFSQILTAPFQFTITRYLADKLYAKEYSYLRPSLAGSVKIVFVLSLMAIIAFAFNRPLPLYFSFLAGSLFLILAIMWLVMVYLSAAKDYEGIAKAFVYGGLTAILLTMYFLWQPLPFSQHNAATNMLLAYVCGMFLTLVLLLRTLDQTIPIGNNLQFDFLRYLGRYPTLFFTGLFYTLGIWVDTIIVWHSPHSGLLLDTFRFALIYDQAKFLAYLTIVPTAVLFLVHVETQFYGAFCAYYDAVREKSTLAGISLARERLAKLVQSNIALLVERQALVSLTLIVLADAIFVRLGWSVLVKDAFRLVSLGAFANAMLLVLVLILLYFEARAEATLASAIFFFGNALTTYLLLPLGEGYFGLGLLVGASAGFWVALVALIRRLHHLTRITFAMQPFVFTRPSGFWERVADRLNGN